ncbi:MAG TPA: hypothetical protein VMW48_09855 [Vicinamibacterales bacterium]|nr:hypothetical protein [Vicinamibacterales bacterium]
MLLTPLKQSVRLGGRGGNRTIRGCGLDPIDRLYRGKPWQNGTAESFNGRCRADMSLGYHTLADFHATLSEGAAASCFLIREL